MEPFSLSTCEVCECFSIPKSLGFKRFNAKPCSQRARKELHNFYFFIFKNFVALTIGGNKGVLTWLVGFSFPWVLSFVPKPSSVEDKGKSWRVLSSVHEMPILCMCRLMGRCWGNTSLPISYKAEDNSNEITHGGRKYLFQHSRLILAPPLAGKLLNTLHLLLPR